MSLTLNFVLRPLVISPDLFLPLGWVKVQDPRLLLLSGLRLAPLGLAIHFIFVHPTCWLGLSQASLGGAITCYLLDPGVAATADGLPLDSHFPGTSVAVCPFTSLSFRSLYRLLIALYTELLFFGCVVNCPRKPSHAGAFRDTFSPNSSITSQSQFCCLLGTETIRPQNLLCLPAFLVPALVPGWLRSQAGSCILFLPYIQSILSVSDLEPLLLSSFS